VNTSKSSLLFSKNTLDSTIRSIKGIIPYKKASPSSCYLGLPFIIGKSKKETFQPVLDKVLNKIEGWQAKTLSQAGRTVLIKANVAAIPSYTMSTYMLPISLCNTLDRGFKKIWWGFPKDKSRNLSLKSWSSICMPRSHGGLGIRDMKSANLALIAKLGWKILNNSENIWCSYSKRNISNMGIFSLPQLLFQLRGSGRVYRSVNLLSNQDHVFKWLLLLIFLSGQLRGFQLYLIISLCRNFQIIGTCQLNLYQILFSRELQSGIIKPLIGVLIVSRFKRLQKSIFLQI
jgi:hypothetical protein